MTNEVLTNVYIITLDPIFSENAICLSNKLGLEIVKDFKPKSKDLYIVFGAHLKSVELLKIQKDLSFSFGYIILNSESQKSHFLLNKYYLELMRKNVVFNYSHGVAEYLKKDLDIKTYSYFFFEFMSMNKAEDREYDILFIGSKTKHREEQIACLKEAFPYKKFYIDFEQSHRCAQSMKDILNKSKWVLNIPYYENDGNLETHRINNALSCGCDVVSFKSGDSDTDEFYGDYIYFSDDLVSFFKCHEVKEKKSYNHLIKGLSGKWLVHNGFIIKKLKELNNH
jgi:hypothetical protein